MTNDEQMLAQARMMNEFREAAKRLAVLKDEAYQIGSKLMEMGKTLCDNLAIKETEFSYLDPSKIKSLVEDYKSTSQKVSRLKGSLIAIGWIDEGNVVI